MKIKKVLIHNWRSIKDEEIYFQDMMVFIGQNNHGKSNILTAILFFFGEIKFDQLDFHEGTNELFVEILFDNLDDNDKITFKKYLSSDGTIKVRKSVIAAEGSSEYHGYVEEPNIKWLKNDNAMDYTKRSIADSTPLKEYLPESGRILKDMIIEAQRKYIEDHRKKLSFSTALESNNFLGRGNVAQGIWGDIFFIPAVKKVTDELSTKSATVFNQLYSRVLSEMSDNNPEFQNAKHGLSSLVKNLNKLNEDGSPNEERPDELTKFEELLDNELTDWDAEIDVEITPPDLDNIFRVGTKVWINDGTRTDASRKGQGLQRALIFCLVRALAKHSELSKTGEGVTRRASRSTYFIIEEPELFLHPQAQRAVFESLCKLSKSSQIVMCTHSSSFINLDWYKSICRVYKSSSAAGTKINQHTKDLFLDEREKDEFNMVYWINPDRSELFFAKKVILLEGQTDKTVISYLARKIDVYKHDYTLIECGSKNSIPLYIQLLNYFSIPYVAVYDKDHQLDKTAQDITNADNTSELINKVILPNLGKSVILDNDIEEELKMPNGRKRNKAYVALQHISSHNYQISAKLKAKIESIYQ